MSRGGGQVVSVLAFYSDDPRSNLAEAYSFSLKFVFEKTKINKTMSGLAHFLKKITYRNILLRASYNR